MLKLNDSMNQLESQAGAALEALLGQVPAISLKGIRFEAPGVDRGVDILVDIAVGNRRHVLACEVKSSGQPRHVRLALLQLRDYVAHLGGAATPILIAPYLSPEAQALCREQGGGFLDLEGNARIVFDGVFIERCVAHKPVADRRGLRSLFKPKSAQILRVMLREPARAWRVAELAEAAEASIGHVSNVRTALLDREWAMASPDGMSLTDPNALLDAWRDAYEPPAGERLRFYTTLHGRALEEAANNAVGVGRDGRATYASFSAAHWLAPYGRISTQFFYADSAGLEKLRVALKLSAATKGENVVVVVPKDEGLFRDMAEPASGVVCTGPVQTYLDLAATGERGREAAEHLRSQRLIWSK